MYKYEQLLLTESRKFYDSLPDDIIDLQILFSRANKDLFIVGGAVRDHLLAKKVKDYDLATNATPDQVEEILKNYYQIINVGKAYGVTKVIVPGYDEPIEIATFREDIGSGRRPNSVVFSNIETDVKRRDLTINALFFDIKDKKIVDLVNGVEDLKNNIIRTVGSAKLRFNEDPLRKLRVIRFAAKLAAKLDPEILLSLEEDPDIRDVSKERIRDEFVKTIKTAHDQKWVIEFLFKYRLIEQILPNNRINRNIINSNDYILVLSSLLIDNAPIHLEKTLNASRYTLDEIKKINFLISLKELNLQNCIDLKKKLNKSGLDSDQVMEFAKYLKLNLNLVKALINFEFTVNSDSLARKGFSGKKLGEEILRLETINFSKFLKHS